MTPGRPFIDPRDADLDYCPACGSFSWTGTGHVCPNDDPLGFWRGLLPAAAVCVLFWILLIAGVARLDWRPW